MLAALRLAGPRLLDGEQRDRLRVLPNLFEAVRSSSDVPPAAGTVVLN